MVKSSSISKPKQKSNEPPKAISKKIKQTLHRFLKKRLEWNPVNEKFININMNEYSPIKLPKICNLISDTPIFSRLKRIKQLGSCSYVFPSATHTRFEHSIGTARLAYKALKNSQKNLPKEYKLKGNEFLDALLAALSRNLGHPAFSYLYEECFATPGLHKEMSVKLFNKMLFECLEMADGLGQFLTERDFNLIRCLINPPPMFEINGKWNLPISPKKAYIFDIVNNLQNGLDVDKLDYIYRDGLRCGMNKYAINMNIVKRIIKSAVVGRDHRGRFCCLKYPENNSAEIKTVFKSKIELFKTVYHDRRVLAKDEMFKKALKLAGRHLMFRTKAGLQIPLERCHEDLDAYIQLTDDSLYEKILHPASDHSNLLEAQKILLAIEKHQIPKLVAEIESVGKNNRSLSAEEIKNSFENCAALKRLSIAKEITVITKSIHAGKNFKDNPMASVLFYPRNDRNKSVLVNKTVQSVIRTYIFAPYGSKIEEVEKLFEVVKDYCTIHNLESPVLHFRPRFVDCKVV